MNLLHDPWIPVRDEHGQRAWITPDRLSEPQWRAFDADRPDFNGALAQFAIGLLQTTTSVADSIEWRRLFRVPPDAGTLREWFEPVAAAFELDGDGSRFMQDFGLATEAGKSSPIAELLIEAPGESTVTSNRDFFVKRNLVNKLCPACAATAALTLQLNAPEGGRGHFTGMRGGGPLTTLIWQSGKTPLWEQLWLNVADRSSLFRPPGDEPQGSQQLIFPWLGATEGLHRPGGALTIAQANSLHAFWAMPRRIRLDFVSLNDPAACDICTNSSRLLVREFRSRPNGVNYPSISWIHPLTPYRLKDGSWLPTRPNPNTRGYRQWLAWTLSTASGAERCASIVSVALTARNRQVPRGLTLWAYGFEMRKDKAVAWHESTLPIFSLPDCGDDEHKLIQSEVARWLDAATLAGSYLRGAVKDAWFSADARGEFGHIDASFWSATEPAFYRQLQDLIDATRDKADRNDLPVRDAWHRVLTGTALHLFDHAFVGAGPIERQNPRRIALAHRQLCNSLYGDKLKSALGLPTNAPAKRPARKRAAGSNNTAPQEAA